MGTTGAAKLDGQYGYRQPIHNAIAGWVDTSTGGRYLNTGGYDATKSAALEPQINQQADALRAQGYPENQVQAFMAGQYAQGYKGLDAAKTTTTPTGPNGSSMMDALLRQYNQNPYAALSMQLLQNTQNAQKNGADALNNLLNELNARKNPYADLHFQDANATANPLAAYMQASGAGTGQVDAYSKLLQQLEQNAVNADSNRAAALGASFNADTASRVSNAQTEQAGFLQQLQQQLLSQQNNVAQMQQKYKNDLYMQMAQLAAKYGMPMPKVV